MTKEELKAKIDELIGMESALIDDGMWDTSLRYTSPTGVVLFDVNIVKDRGGWRFSGNTGVLPGMWRYLTAAHCIVFV